MAINIKFTKFDNTPWGFRLAGGSDFPQPLTVIRVSSILFYLDYLANRISLGFRKDQGVKCGMIYTGHGGQSGRMYGFKSR